MQNMGTILYNILDTYGAHAEILFANHLPFGIHKLIKYQNIRVFHLKTFMYNNVKASAQKGNNISVKNEWLRLATLMMLPSIRLFSQTF
jgi:hypothetical protein